MNTLKNKYFIIFLFSNLVFFNSYSTTFPQEGFSYEKLDLGNFMRNRINKHVRILNFELGKTTLNEIVRVLGKSALVIAGKGHDRVKQICYKSDKPSDHTLLIFSTNFINGKIANEIKIKESAPNEIKYKKCAASSKIHKHIKTESGLGLNLSESDLQSIAGFHNENLEAPIDTTKLQFRSYYNFKMVDEEIKELGMEEFPYWSVIFTIIVEIKKNKITSLTVAKHIST